MTRSPLMCAALLLVLAVASAAEGSYDYLFEDLPTDHWAYAAVREFTTGDWAPLYTYPPSFTATCKPRMTRYEFAVVTVRLCELLRDDEDARSKVSRSQPSALRKLIDEFRDAIAPLGFDANRMKRSLAVIQARYRPAISVQDCPELAETPPDHWAYASMKRLYEMGVLEGCPKP